jgi:proteasome lid subunit RPN8/RPN11
MRLLFLTGQSGNSKKSPVDTFYFDIEQKKGRRSPRAYGNVLSVVVNPGCFHNHPSGDPNPSEADLRLTRRINEAPGFSKSSSSIT